MDFKPSEIIIVILAFMIPTALFAALIIPGTMMGMIKFVTSPEHVNFVFGGLAVIAVAVLAFRLFRRMRPASKKKGDDGGITGLFKNPFGR